MYQDWQQQQQISLGEGNTPLLRSRSIGPASGLTNLFFKLETVNPTGSYKDRFAAAAVSDMLRKKQRRVVASSSGNTGAALAAYCAAAGMECQIAVVIDAPEGKLKQMLAYGAKLWKIEGFGNDAKISEQTMKYLQQLGNAEDACLQISTFCHSPVGMAGVESIGTELVSQGLEQDLYLEHVFSCAGGGGLTLAVARGLESESKRRKLQTRPRVHCVQPEGNNTIAGPLRAGKNSAQSCGQSTTKITGLQVASVLDGNAVISACRDSRGTGYLVSDEEVYYWQAELARREGIFCEPASAVPLAGAMKAVETGEISADSVIVCLVTGSGFKDLVALDRMLENKSCPVLSLADFQALTASPLSSN